MDHIKGGFLIVSSVLDVQVGLPAVITPSIRIDRPDADQIEMIRTVLIQMAGGVGNPTSYYECEWRKTDLESGARYESAPLKPADWRYYIVAYTGTRRETYKVLDAANLISSALEAFAHVDTDGEFGAGRRVRWGGDAIRGVTFYRRACPAVVKVFDEAALDQLKSAHQQLLELDRERYKGIARAIDMMKELKRIPLQSNLRVLMLFATIEMLLTHKPSDEAVGDSLSHQISTKVPLLSKRFSEPLSYDRFYPITQPDEVWKKLYQCRSQIAHGEPIDFEENLRDLKGLDNVHRFLEDAVRRLVRHSLDEPDLVDALKLI